jgi:hypothetical protein
LSSFGDYSLNNLHKPFYSGEQLMDNKKFEQLIDLIINEDEDKARALFHDIVVEKSREIYESMMDEDMGMGGIQNRDQVGGLQQEISTEEQGMVEDEDEFADIEMDDSEGDMDVELDSDDMGDGEMGDGEEDLEDRVVDLEDKLDQLMAEFEEIMGNDGEEDMGGDDMGGDDMGGDEMMEGSDEELEESEEEVTEEEDEDTLEESVQLQKVKSVTHGDNGDSGKSPVAGKNPIGARPANKLGGHESTTGGTQGGLLKPTASTIPGKYKNAPGATFSEKGEAAPKPKHGDNGQNKTSITTESRKSVKKPITKPVAQATKKIVKR